MGAVGHKILRFPTDRTSHPAREGATALDVIKSRLRETIGRVANRLGLPGAIRPIEIHDATTGYQIRVSVGTSMVRLTVNGRDFYFDRLTGRLDGTGSMAC